MKDFVDNEIGFGIIDQANRSLLESGERLLDDLRKIRADDPKDHQRVTEAREKLKEDRTKYKLQGDRITSLMAAHNCPLPDHVTSPFTYENEHDACETARARGDKGEQERLCNIVGIAYDRLSIPSDEK